MIDWFYHDVGARNSRKLRIVRATFSGNGYAWFFMLLEMLREEPDYMLDLSHEHNVAVVLAELAIERVEFDKFIALCILVGLFAMDGEKLFSPSLLIRMKRYLEVRETYRKNGAKGGRPSQKKPSGSETETKPKPSGSKNITKPEPSGLPKITDKNRIDKNRLEEKGLDKPKKSSFENLFTEAENQNPEFILLWQRWATSRKGKLTESIALTRLEELRKWGMSRAIAALRHSVGYIGIFEPTNSNGNNNAKQTAATKFGGHDEESIARIIATNSTSASGVNPGDGH